ncbi:uncharacterized protein LOC132927037 [Rhopalosiphum padi]|uniref:uncharacterized protein LOC132927037 n=1 Tax=Rhopalosiphum padi TaxID=40932 RepID=UPI00298E10AE|nr:uncharacterized protein LOC132927037 [Rhopalosiphum padi]
MMIRKVFVFIGLFYLSESKENPFMPNLSLGEYRTVFDRVYACESTKNHLFQYNVYFSKKSSNITELRGNITFLIPFDDNFILELNIASWSLTGGWKPNSAVYITKNACSKMKHILGKAWFSMAKTFNAKNDCPLPAGTYISSGIDLKKLEDYNLPKVYFYGKYKAVFKIKNTENKILGCGVFEVNLIRPWEKPI